MFASEKIGSQHSIYSLVLTDWRMPGLTGIELALYLSKIDPGIKIILISALSSDEAYYLMGDVKFDHISMPVTTPKLLEVINNKIKNGKWMI